MLLKRKDGSMANCYNKKKYNFNFVL